MIDGIFPKSFKLKGFPSKTFSLSSDQVIGTDILLDVTNEDGSTNVFGKFPIEQILQSMKEAEND